MMVVIRQYGKVLVTIPTRSRKKLSERDIVNANAAVISLPTVEQGYYDVVLTSRPDDPRYDVDSIIEVA